MLCGVVENWLQSDDDEIVKIERDLTWMTRQLYDQYEPDSFSRFGDRLDEWLRQVDDEDEQKAMFRLLPQIFFVGREQFASLFRAGYRDVATRWLIDQVNIDILASDAAEKIEQGMRRTWFCPLTDSMRINSFLKVNDDGGHAIRPDWRSLAKLGDAGDSNSEGIRKFVSASNIERLVLVEDFVGSGSQMAEAVDFALEALPGVPILVVPLVCCPVGAKEGYKLAEEYDQLHFEPVLTLPKRMFLTEQPHPEEDPAFTAARPLCKKYAERYGSEHFDRPFGFEATGALVVLHTNCPDNTIPLIHADGQEWSALFPRINRN